MRLAKSFCSLGGIPNKALIMGAHPQGYQLCYQGGKPMLRLGKALAAGLMATTLMLAAAADLEAAAVSRRTILAGTGNATEVFVIESGVPGPTVWVSGGVHGSELAGWKAAEQIARWQISRGRLIVVPHANKPAVNQQQRAAAGGSDLNRQFPNSSGQRPQGALATALWQTLQQYKPDWVFDLHEALGNRNLSSDSVGQTIIVHPHGSMSALANQVARQINRSLPSKQAFRVIKNPVHGSLAHAAGEVLRTNAAIVETSRMYSLTDRINWHLRIMRQVLEELNMNPQSAGAATDAAA